jgi:hypothetical protein
MYLRLLLRLFRRCGELEGCTYRRLTARRVGCSYALGDCRYLLCSGQKFRHLERLAENEGLTARAFTLPRTMAQLCHYYQRYQSLATVAHLHLTSIIDIIGKINRSLSGSSGSQVVVCDNFCPPVAVNASSSLISFALIAASSNLLPRLLRKGTWPVAGSAIAGRHVAAHPSRILTAGSSRSVD